MANTIEKRQDVETQIIVRALKDDSFKQQLLNDPDFAKAEIEKALGQKVIDGSKVQVLQETADTAYIVLPYVASTGDMTDEQLEAVASGTFSVGGNFAIPCWQLINSATFQNGVDLGVG